MLYRFNNTEDQIKAADVVREALGDQYVVALNLADALDMDTGFVSDCLLAHAEG